MIKKVTLLLGYISSAFLMCACKSNNLQDLRLESVNRISLSEAKGMWSAAESKKSARVESIFLLKISFSSQSDFIKLAKENTLHLSYRVSSCSTTSVEGPPFFVLPDLYVKNFSVGTGPYSNFPDLERFRGSNGRFLYNIMVPIAGDEVTRLFGEDLSPGQNPFLDPSEFSTGICMQVTAAAMGPSHTLHSNVIRAPTLELSKLFN